MAPAAADPVRYALSTKASSVGFETDLSITKITGKMPIRAADLSIDFTRLGNSQVDVTLYVSGARANFPVATEAMKGPNVLDARTHPDLTFHSTSLKAEGAAARVTGKDTLRGVTRPLVLNAEIRPKAGSSSDDLSNLVVRLTGTLHRSEFDATGWADMMGEDVRITTTARITAQE